jgi:hypothetical protein
MAVTLIGEIVNSCDATTGFNQGNISSDDPFIEGTGAIGLKNSNGTQQLYTTSLGAGAPYDFSTTGPEAGYHIIMWFNTKSPINATTGLRIYVGDSTPTASNGLWNVMPLGLVYNGGFITAVVNTARDFDAATTWTTTGNPAQLTNIDEMGGEVTTITMISGNFNNMQIDQITIGEGLRVDAGTVGTPNTFEIVRAADEDTAYYGWWSQTAGAFLGKGKLYIGPATGSATSVFTDADFVVSFAEERVATGFYEISMRGGGTDVTWDRGTIFAANPTTARWGITVESDTNGFDTTDCNFIGSDTISLNSATTITGGSIIDGTSLTQNGATLDGISIIDANTADDVGYIIADNPGNIKNCSFTFSDGHAITIDKEARLGAMSAAIADDGGAFTNETTASNNATTNDMTLLPATPAVNDFYYFGKDSTFDELSLNISTAGSGTWTIAWQYFDGVIWLNLSGVTDGTTGFTTGGVNAVSWTVPIDWETTTVNSQGPYYYVRARVTSFTSVTTAPQAEQCWVYTEAATFTFDGNEFSGYGADASTDAAIYNNSGGEITLNLQNVAAVPTIKNGTGATTNADITVTVSVTVKDADDSSVVQGARVLLEADSGGDLAVGTDILDGTTNASGVIEDTGFNFTNPQPVTGRVRKGTSSTYYKTSPISGTISSSGFSVETFVVKDE